MDRYGRNLVLDIFDYSGRRLCNLYDNSFDISGQACNVVVTTERNGWKELSFTIPSVCETENGTEDNFRIAYLKADYRIRQIDDKEIDWFLISEPKVVHQNFSKNVSVTAGHVAQLLKTKNLGLEFSDDEGNNIGTAEELLTTILRGTGWKVGNVDVFYEKDGTTIKKRSLQAESKTGAFKQITKMCDLFDAKPVFHGDSKTVDIMPMNPFSMPDDGGLPDVTKADGVQELHYGQNVSGITRVLNTENQVTKQYAYGAYGDTTSGYCGIDECTHTEHVYTLAQALDANVSYVFIPPDHSARTFTPPTRVASGSRLIWSTLDPVSMSYIWNETSQVAYPVQKQGIIYYVDENGNPVVDSNDISLSANKMLVANHTTEEKQNWFAFLMDFSYYQQIGLLTDDMLQAIARYQRHGAQLYEHSYEASEDYLNSQTELHLLVGTSSFCKLNVDRVDETGTYTKLVLDANPIVYRTDYLEKARNYAKWIPATGINDIGDALNDTAGVMYIVHNTVPVTWDKVYIQAFNDTQTTAQDGESQAAVSNIVLWSPSGTLNQQSDDRFYLFGTGESKGALSGLESSYEAALLALAQATKVVTANHPVYLCSKEEGLPPIDSFEINGYAWAWLYDDADLTPSTFYFYYGGDSNSDGSEGADDPYQTTWAPVYFAGSMPPTTIAEPAYWYNWGNLNGWEQSTLYAIKDGVWTKATNEVINAKWTYSDAELGVEKTIVYDIMDTWKYFATVYWKCIERDLLYQGVRNYYSVEVTFDLLNRLYPDDMDQTELPAGNYYIEDAYHAFHLFATKTNLPLGTKLKYNAHKLWIEQVSVDGVSITIESERRSCDSVMYNNDQKNMIVADKEHYLRLSPVEAEGDLKGIIEYVAQFSKYADVAYGNKLSIYLAAQEELSEMEEDLLDVLGDLHREGWWQTEDYVDGDEQRLYEDALDNLEKIAQPDASYTVSFLDRYGANDGMEFGNTEATINIRYPDISMMSAVHLVDPEIAVNEWAYIDKLAKCYDQPWKTTQAINTNQTAMTQHSFTDVMVNIANVASELKGKMTYYKRAGALTADGMLATERLEGAIDAAKLKIFGGNSTWYTDDSGNLVFESADGASAMTLTGNGFAIANSKNEWGEWNWRVFGTGNGFTADEIVTGFLSADCIQANSIGSWKLDQNTQDLLGWAQGASIELTPENIRNTVTGTVIDEMGNETGELRQSVIEQTASDIRLEFNTALKDISDLKQLNNNLNAWFNFSGEGLKIGAKDNAGNNSPFYTLQDNDEYGFWKNNTQLARITGYGMEIPQIDVSTQFRLGNLYADIEEDGSINWTYNTN